MDERIKHAFHAVHAEPRLKGDTLAVLQTARPHEAQKSRRIRLGRFAVLACLIMLTLTGVFHRIYATETMYVDVDINPSIELVVNPFDRIIGVHAYNADGAALLAQLALVHKSCNRGVELLTEAAMEQGFLSDGGMVSVTLQTDADREDGVTLETLQTNISSVARRHHTVVQVDAFAVDASTRGYAHEQNLSPAKYLAILELQTVDPTATVEGCRHRTIGQLREQTEVYGGHHSTNGVYADSEQSQEIGATRSRGRGHHRNGH